MSKVLTSFDCATLSVPELVQYFSDQDATKIDTFTLGNRVIVMFDISRSAMQVDAVNDLEMLEFSPLVGYAIKYTPYSDGEDYHWSRSRAFGKSTLKKATYLIEKGYEEASSAIDEVIGTLSQVFKLSNGDCEKLILKLKGML